MAVIESKGNGFSLYNGVKIPSFPEYDKEKYPYAALYGFSATKLYLSTIPYAYTGSKVVAGGSNVSGMRTMYSVSDGKWEVMAEDVTSRVYANLTNPEQIIWTNHDILNETDNSVYFAASEPISLDGMNVIEWDGDTTELDKWMGTSDQWFCVSHTTDIDVSKEVATVRRYLDGRPLAPNLRVMADKEGYFTVANARYVQTASETYPVAGVYLMDFGDSYYTSLFAYYPIAEPEQPEEPEGDIGAGVKFLIRQIFNNAFAEVLIRQMRE